MNVYWLVAMIIGNFILQSTIFQYFRIGGILPNTALLIVVTISILYGRKRGVMTGIIAGLLQDLFFGKAIGINILIYSSIGYIIGGVENKVFKDNLVTPFLFILSTTIYYHSIYFVFMHFLRQPVNYLTVLKSVVMIEVVYNLVVGIVFYRIFYRKVY
ncbi:rod shape-determining protein MreD [Wukongibacter baidiensis]|uniref:rod shape-determining protein MreD n=1 Tax=Wukongibacter baidiensis TaxID=1723361 RepID=UPI003D7FEF38